MKTSTTRALFVLIAGLLCGPAWGQLPTLGAGGGFGGGVPSEPLTANRLIQKSSPTYLLPQIWPVNTGAGIILPQAPWGRWALSVDLLDTGTFGSTGTAAVAPSFAMMGGTLGISMNGSTQSVDVGNAPAANFGTDDFLISFVIQTTNNSRNEAVLSKRVACTFGNFFEVSYGAAGLIGAEIDNGDAPSDQGIGSVTSINDGKPHSVAFYRSGTLLQVWIDGRLDNSATLSTTSNVSNAATLKFGTAPCGAYSRFTGRLRDVRYQRRMNAGQIPQIATFQRLGG